MSVTLESKNRIAALIAAANAATGNADTDLTAAVAALIGGFGQGGVGEDLLASMLSNTLTEYSNETLEAINTYGFYGSSNLAAVNLPALKTVAMNAFRGTGLQQLVLPLLKEVSTSMCWGCASLALVDFGVATEINGSAFRECSNLSVVILRNPNAVVSLANTLGFSGTPFYTDGTGGTLYVPQALVETYKTAANWSALYTAGTCNIAAIEGSEYE